MIPQKAIELAQSVSGILVSGNPEAIISSVSIDSRTLIPGELFIPLKGENFDGQNFIAAALRKGASGFVTEQWNEDLKTLTTDYGGSLVIKVGDSLKALQLLATAERQKSRAKVVGITGSTGKTCTKNLLESILAMSHRIAASPKNFNNEIGVPLTIIKAKPEVDVFIVEMGMRGLGQIGELCGIARPDIGVITNIGDSHIELVGSRDLIAKAKGELVEALPADGFAVLNADDPRTPQLAGLTQAKVITFGMSPAADIYTDDIYLDKEAKATFVVRTPGEKYSVNLSIPGRHTIYNALAALTIATCLGVDSSLIREGLAKAQAAEMRLNVDTNSKGVVIINDAYNANPASVRAALETATAMDGIDRRIVVLGDMAELGSLSDQAHYEVGKAVADAGIDTLVTVGSKVKKLNKGAVDAGFAESRIHFYRDKEAALKFLRRYLRPNDLVLVKASRFMGFEKIAEGLKSDK